MHPVLVRFGADWPVHTYGVLVMFAFAIALLLVATEGRKVGITSEKVADFGFWALVTSLVGSRVLFLVVNAGPYWDACFHAPPGRRDCLLVLEFWKGGLVFYGGLVGAIGGSILWARRAKVPFLLLADVAAPSIALGHAWGRLGCFFAGCCYGKPSHSALAVAFPRASLAWIEWVRTGEMPRAVAATPPLHPTQLYEAFGELALFFLLLFSRRKKRFTGQTIATYLLGYALLRSALEVLRADTDRGYLLRLPWPALSRVLGLPAADPVILSTAQAVSLLVAAAAAAILVFVPRRRVLSVVP
jgi:phosphatidylglycerol:prolipoprotein diacylglycerol transferase